MKSIEDSLIALLQIRKDHPEIGWTVNHKWILGKLKHGARVKDWKALAVKLELSKVEMDILTDSRSVENWSIRRGDGLVIEGITRMKAKFGSWKRGWEKGYRPEQDTMMAPTGITERVENNPEWCRGMGDGPMMCAMDR